MPGVPGYTKEGDDSSPWVVKTDFPEKVIPKRSLKYGICKNSVSVLTKGLVNWGWEGNAPGEGAEEGSVVSKAQRHESVFICSGNQSWSL